MTQPSAENLVPDEEALAFEEDAVAYVVTSLALALGPVIGSLLAAYASGTVGPALAAWLARTLGRLWWDPMTPALRDVATDAVELGVDRALRPLPREDRRRGMGPGPALDLPDLDHVTKVRLDSARDLAHELPMTTKRDVMAVAGRLSAAKSRAEGQVRWTATEGINAGAAAVARRLDAGLLWVAERDACLHCLAHAGWSVEPGETFPPGLTFGDKPLREDGVPYPPLHPGCRCQVRVWRGKTGAPSADRSSRDPAARVAAEARRSVVYGWTSYASGTATLRAMDRLLRRGAALPPSVERRARELVRRGRTLARPK